MKSAFSLSSSKTASSACSCGLSGLPQNTLFEFWLLPAAHCFVSLLGWLLACTTAGQLLHSGLFSPECCMSCIHSSSSLGTSAGTLLCSYFKVSWISLSTCYMPYTELGPYPWHYRFKEWGSERLYVQTKKGMKYRRRFNASLLTPNTAFSFQFSTNPFSSRCARVETHWRCELEASLGRAWVFCWPPSSGSSGCSMQCAPGTCLWSTLACEGSCGLWDREKAVTFTVNFKRAGLRIDLTP